MNESLILTLAGVTGLALGAAFFGGLWWTVRKATSSPRPARWFLGSALLRMGVALGGFYLVGSEHWDRLLFCLLGFVAARVLITRLARSPAPATGLTTTNK